MLILTRRIGEKIMIGNDIEVVIIGVNMRGVEVGVTAPKEVTILRAELTKYDDPKKKQQANQSPKPTEGEPPVAATA